MKTKNIGIIIICIGILMMIYTGFNFVTNEKIVEIGSIKIEKKQNHPIQWTPAIGAVLIVGGIIVIVRGNN